MPRKKEYESEKSKRAFIKLCKNRPAYVGEDSHQRLNNNHDLSADLTGLYRYHGTKALCDGEVVVALNHMGNKKRKRSTEDRALEFKSTYPSLWRTLNGAQKIHDEEERVRRLDPTRSRPPSVGTIRRWIRQYP